MILDRQVWANSAIPDQSAEEKPDQGPHCLLIPLHFLRHNSKVELFSSNLKVSSVTLFDVQKIMSFMLIYKKSTCPGLMVP